MSEEILQSFEKQLQGAVRVCVQRLKHVANTSEARAEVMYDFNQEIQSIVASAEQYFNREELIDKKAFLMDRVNRIVKETYEEVEIHVSVLPRVESAS